MSTATTALGEEPVIAVFTAMAEPVGGWMSPARSAAASVAYQPATDTGPVGPVDPVFADVLIDRTAGCLRCRALRLLVDHPGATIAMVATTRPDGVVAVATRDGADGRVRSCRLPAGAWPDGLVALARQLYQRWSVGSSDLVGTLGEPQHGEQLRGG